MRDGAVGAVPRADVAEDHEGRGAVLPALADVRAVRFLADRVEVELAHQLLEPEVLRPAGSANLEPARLSLGQRFDAVAAGDLIQRLAHEPRGEVMSRVSASGDRRDGRRDRKPLERRNLPLPILRKVATA